MDELRKERAAKREERLAKSIRGDLLTRQLRSDLADEQKAEALRIGRIEFKSTGARRQK